MMKVKRVENTAWGTVDFIDPDANNDDSAVVFQTIPEVSRARKSQEKILHFRPQATQEILPLRRQQKKLRLFPPTGFQEKNRVVLQLGTGDATRALQSAMVAAKDVAAIDINMGCPLKFSTASGAGSALLKKPETVHDILTTLRRNLPAETHVTCKIRLLETMEKTVELARVIEKCGVSAFGVHGRYVGQRPRDPAHWDQIKQVVESVSCPVIANGDVFEYTDFDKLRAETGAAAAMCGRGAMWNQSIFRREGVIPARDNLNSLLEKCFEWNHSLKNTKYLTREILIKSTGLENEEGWALNKTKSLADVAGVFNIQANIIGRKRVSSLKRPCEDPVENDENKVKALAEQ
tara:strand:+ start:2751 stop:3797 length:1047 start_codon:yes stop_codon:yes gene_type:complete